MKRRKTMENWLKIFFKVDKIKTTVASADASFRQYFRVVNQGVSYIVMDAPPEYESLEPFLTLTKSFRKFGLNTPEVFAVNNDDGFLLLSDFGDTTLLGLLDESNADELYKKAIDVMIDWQKADVAVPDYDLDLLKIELYLFDIWYLKTHLGVELSDENQLKLEIVYKQLIESALIQPQVCVHRDFHSRNLMITADNKLGIIDFQDAVVGAITYDLVSLLRDCYISWPDEQVTKWLRYFYDKTPNKLYDFKQLEKWFDWMGLQRHLKVAGIFARLHHQDGKSQYLNDLPLVIEYIKRMLNKYPELDFPVEAVFKKSLI